MITLNIQNIKTGICLGFTQSEKKKSFNQSEWTLSIGHQHSYSGGMLAAYLPAFEQQEDRNPHGTQYHRTDL